MRCQDGKWQHSEINVARVDLSPSVLSSVRAILTVPLCVEYRDATQDSGWKLEVAW
jgi:hypothetical protein